MLQDQIDQLGRQRGVRGSSSCRSCSGTVQRTVPAHDHQVNIGCFSAGGSFPASQHLAVLGYEILGKAQAGLSDVVKTTVA